MSLTQPYALCRVFRVGTAIQWEVQEPVAAGGWVMTFAGTEGDMLLQVCADSYILFQVRPDPVNAGNQRYWFRMPS